MAILHGLDPIAVTDLEGIESRLVIAAFEEADRIRRERLADHYRAMQTVIHNGIATAFKRT